MSETRKFDAEVGKILHLMIHSLYTNKDIFLRELVSNASDACDKLRYLSITTPVLMQDNHELKINISVDKDKRTVWIADNGIGMNKEDLIENLGTIARSGTQNFVSQLTGDSRKDIQLIGQFGVGFYSGFMVADKITVISRKAGEEQGYMWESKGDGEFTVSEVEGKIDRGTNIHLHLKEGEDDYLDKFRLQHIINTYSDHISVPIEFKNEDGEFEVLNKASALWMRPKSEITEEQYSEFYKHVSYSPDQPWMSLHNKNEGTIEYTNLLFIPSRRPFDLFHPDRKARVKLYVKRVFITDDNVQLVPAFMRFIRGIVDSEDLPLNISRETLQHNHVIEKIRKSIVKRVISELKKKLENERESYVEFWNNFGAVLKEGLCEPMESRENLMEVCLFKSALTGNWITLDEYIASMKEGQEHIYYYLNEEDPEKAKLNPQLEGFLKRKIDVLLYTDQVDDFWVNVEHQYKEKELKSVTRAGSELENVKSDDTADKEQNSQQKIDNIDQVLEFFKDTLGTSVKDVKTSFRLVDSPVCLAVADGAMDIKMERFLLEQKQLHSASAKILEINPNHPIIRNIAEALNNDDASKDNCKELAQVLFDQACILEGEPISDTGAFSKRLNNFLQKAIAA